MSTGGPQGKYEHCIVEVASALTEDATQWAAEVVSKSRQSDSNEEKIYTSSVVSSIARNLNNLLYEW